MTKQVIADLYQVPKVNGKYNPDHKILKRRGVKVSRDYAEMRNQEENGVLYIIDEVATQKNHDAKKDHTANRHAKLNFSRDLNRAKLGVVFSANTPNTSTSTTDGESWRNGKAAELLSYAQSIGFDCKLKAQSGAKKILAEIDAFIAEQQSNEGEGRKTNPPTED